MNASLPYLIYALFAVGGAGIYLALPRSGRSTAVPGSILGLAAVGMFVAVVAKYALPSEGAGFSYLFSAMALIGAGRVVTHPKAVYCVLYFVLVIISVSMLLVLQGAEFLAIALIVVYAGAILVTYAFVLMLSQQSASVPGDVRSREPFLAVLAGFFTMACIAGQVGDLPLAAAPSSEQVIRLAQHGEADQAVMPEMMVDGNTAAMGAALMTKYVVTLETTGVLLLVALVGAMAVAKKRVPIEESPDPEKPLGQVGREAAPF